MRKLFAYLDDVYVICRPTRVQTKLWNAGGIEPTGAAGPSAAVRMHNPQVVVWPGDQALPTAQHGFKVLGGTSGTP